MSVVTVEAPVDLAALWRALRYPVALVVIGLVLVTALAAIGRSPNTTPLDPRNTAPNGAHALAVLLADRGVAVTEATTLAQLDAASGATILIANPQDLSAGALRSVANTTATVLLVDPLQSALTEFGVDASPDAEIAATTLDPRCSLPAAVTAGSVRITGDLYAAHGTGTSCYLEGGDAALIKSTRSNGATTIVLGSGATLTNAQLGTGGDAALSLGLLDAAAVVWVPSGLVAIAAPASQRGLRNLLPSRLLWATLQLFIAVVVFALWRARRLGRPVTEPLPVVVRAAETVEGRARLLHAARARGAAARSLRTAAARRIATALRLSPDEDSASVSALVAERTHRPATEIDALLYGGDPADDASLVQLAQELPRLETAIRRHDGSSPGGQQ